MSALFAKIRIAFFSLLVLLSMTFFLLRLAPGGPFDGEKEWPAEVKANIEAKYGLDRSLPVQFGYWLRDLTRGDLRESFHYQDTPVREIIVNAFPTSIWLGFYSLFFALVLGLFFGILSAVNRGTWIDTSSMFLAIAGVTLPSYLVATLLVLLFASYLQWLPPALLESRASFILPAIALGIRPMALIARLSRASLLETLTQDYIRTALAKGLPWRSVILKHALRNSLIPVITLMGPITASVITGSYVIEVVFQLPGLGQHFVASVMNRDYPLVMGLTLVYGVILIVSNLLVDLSYSLLDPRIRLGELK